MGLRDNDVISMTELPGLGRYVELRRQEIYLRYDQLAARLGTEVRWLFALEDGKLPGIDPAMLVRLAVALEVDQAILMHHARLPQNLTVSGHRPLLHTETGGQPGAITEDLLLFSDRQSEDDRTHIAQTQQSPERPIVKGSGAMRQEQNHG